MAGQGQFYCVHCGDRFNLDREEQQAYAEGYFMYEPDTCEECADMINHPPHDQSELHSDADCGL
jgi:hypothetical protein